MSENDERLISQGPQGEQGETGQQGERGEHGTAGLSRSVRQAVVFMFAFAVILAASGLFWINHEVHVNSTALQASYTREQESQRQAGVVLGEKLCQTFGRLAALKPPPGNPKTNPSRAYLQGQHDALVQLGTDLGCK